MEQPLEKPLEQSLVANIGLSEKTHYEYIFVDAGNRIHISVPLSGGTEIATDNTCETQTEIRSFAGSGGNQGILVSIEGYIRDLAKDIVMLEEQGSLDGNLTVILGKKRERLTQLLDAQSLLQKLIPPLQQNMDAVGGGYMPELITKKAFKTNRENCVGIILYPPHRDDYLNTSELALFAMQRGNLKFENSFGGKLSNAVAGKLRQYKDPSLQQKNAKITTIAGIFDALEKRLGKETIDLSTPNNDEIFDKLGQEVQTILTEQGIEPDTAKALTKNLFEMRYREGNGYRIAQISRQNIIDAEFLDEKNKDDVERLKNYPIQDLNTQYFKDMKTAIILENNRSLYEETVQPLELLLQTDAPVSKFFNIESADTFSLAVQFFLGIANIRYYEKTGEHINFARTLEAENGQNLIKRIKIAIENNQPIEPVIFSFINEILLAGSSLDKTDQIAIIQKFNALYNLAKDSPHMDEFFLLIPRKGHYVAHQGRICIQLSEYCKQVDATRYQQFFGGSTPKLPSQPLASAESFLLAPSNKETIQIGSISIDFTHSNQYSVNELVQILLAEDPANSEKRFFHSTSDPIKTQIKRHPQWTTIQNRIIGSLKRQSQMMDFCVEWKLFQPLHLTPKMIHALIAQYGMDNELENLAGKSLKEKIAIVFNTIDIPASSYQVPHEDGGLVLLFNHELATNSTIEKIKKICKERETTMHIYPNMAKSLYKTVTSKEPTALDKLNNSTMYCRSQSTITVALQKLLPDLKVYSETEIFTAVKKEEKEKSEKIADEIKNGTAISIGFYQRSGHLLQGTPENLERIRTIHYAKTRITLNEMQIYQLLFALEQDISKFGAGLNAQQKAAIQAGELLPETLTLTDVKSALDRFNLEYTQLQTDGVSYSISMESAEPLQKLLTKHHTLPLTLNTKLRNKRLEVLDKQIEAIDSTIAKAQPLDLSVLKSIQLLSNQLVNASENEAISLACSIDNLAKETIAILQGTEKPIAPKQTYINLVQTHAKLNQKNQRQTESLTKLKSEQADAREKSSKKVNEIFNDLSNKIADYAKRYCSNEQDLSSLQWKNAVPDPMWDQVNMLKGFLSTETIEYLFNLRKTMEFEAYQRVKVGLEQLTALNSSYAHYNQASQRWKVQEINQLKGYFYPDSWLLGIWRRLGGAYQTELNRIENKAFRLGESFQQAIRDINQGFPLSISSPDDSADWAKKYHQTFMQILQENEILFSPAPDKPISINDAEKSLLQECSTVKESLIIKTSPKRPNPPHEIIFLDNASVSSLFYDAKLEVPAGEFTASMVKEALENLKIVGVEKIYPSSKGVILLGHFDEQTKQDLQSLHPAKKDHEITLSSKSYDSTKSHLKDGIIAANDNSMTGLALYADNIIKCREEALEEMQICVNGAKKYFRETNELIPYLNENQRDDRVKEIEGYFETLSRLMLEFGMANEKLLSLINGFLVDSATEATYKNLALQCQVWESSLTETNDYYTAAKDLLEKEIKYTETIQSESDGEFKKLEQKTNELVEKFPLPQWEDSKDKEAEHLKDLENLTASKLHTWIHVQKIYEHLKTQVELETSKYIEQVNDYLNDAKINPLTRLWRALFGTHTKNGIERAQSNLTKLQNTLEAWHVNFDKDLSEAKKSDKFQELAQKNVAQLLQLLSQNLKNVHEDGSGFDQFSYTAYLIKANKNIQDKLKQENTFKFWAKQNKSTFDNKLASENIEESYKQIIKES